MMIKPSCFAFLAVTTIANLLVIGVNGSADECGPNLVCTYDNDHTLTISGSGPMYNFTSISDVPWGAYFALISNVVISDDVTSIGDYAFYQTQFETFVIPSKVTYIGKSAFNGCQLENVTIPDSVEYIGNYSFANCSKLKSIKLPKITKYIGSGAFASCERLESVEIPDGLTSIEEETFNGCIKLKKVTIGKDVTSIGVNAFYNCDFYELNPLNKVTFVGDGSFAYTSLQSITFMETVTSIGTEAFYSSSLINVTFNKGVKRIMDRAFGGCFDLTNVNIPEDLSPYVGISIGESAFSKTAIVNATFGKYATTIGPSSFWGCENLENFVFGEGLVSVGESAFTSCFKLAEAKLPSTLKAIGDNAFWFCNIKNVTIPKSVTSLGFGIFMQCPLSSIDVEAGNPKYKSVGGVLYSQDGTTIIAYPNEKTATRFDIPNTVKTISDQCFAYNWHFSHITIPDSVETIGFEAFSNCMFLQSVVIPDSVTEIREYAFSQCGLNSLTIGDGLTTIGEGAFSACPLSTKLVIGNSVRSIEHHAFLASRLTTLVIPESVVTIEPQAFQLCSFLTTVYYEGSTPITSSTAFSGDTISMICVSPDYNNTQFCGYTVYPQDDGCKQFRGNFTHCLKPSFVDGVIVQIPRKNATEWEKKSDICAEHLCSNETGPIVKITCITNNDTSRLCIKNQCMDDWKNALKGWSVEVGLEGVKYVDIDRDQLISDINSLSQVNKLTVGYETEENESTISIVISVKSEEDANRVADAINTINKEQCSYGIICHKTSVEIHHNGDIDPDSSSIASSQTFVMIVLFSISMMI